MGHGIAQVFALAGHDVDDHRFASTPSLDTVKAAHRARTCATSATTQRAVERVTADRAISPTRVRDADFVVEAVPEDLPLKQKLFAEIEQHVRPDTILASNTSVIPITEIMAGPAATASARSAPIGGTRRSWCRWSR